MPAGRTTDPPLATGGAAEDGWSEFYTIGGALALVCLVLFLARSVKDWQVERRRRKANAEADELQRHPRLFDTSECVAHGLLHASKMRLHAMCRTHVSCALAHTAPFRVAASCNMMGSMLSDRCSSRLEGACST